MRATSPYHRQSSEYAGQTRLTLYRPFMSIVIVNAFEIVDIKQHDVRCCVCFSDGLFSAS